MQTNDGAALLPRFVLLAPETLQPVLAVELDDSSHRPPERQERDRFLDAAFEAAGLPLLRVPAQAGYDISVLHQQIAAALAPGQCSAGTFVGGTAGRSAVCSPAPPSAGWRRLTGTELPAMRRGMVLREASRGAFTVQLQDFSPSGLLALGTGDTLPPGATFPACISAASDTANEALCSVGCSASAKISYKRSFASRFRNSLT